MALTDELIYHKSWQEVTVLCRDNPTLKEQLFQLALQKSQELSLYNIVIAGSAGKTSVKELISLVLETWNEKAFVVNPENHNTRIALAAQILRLKKEVDLGVFEIGARKPGDFEFPLLLLKPKVALLLNVGLAHVGEFGSVQNLLTEKLSVLKSETLDFAIVNGDDARILKAARDTKTPLVSFGRNVHNDIQVLSENGSEIIFRVGSNQIGFKVNVMPPNFSINLAAVLALTIYLNIPFSVIQTALMKFYGVKRRFESHEQRNSHIIDDAFNSSPESLYSGLKKVAEMSTEKKVLLVLGSMKELGAETELQHRRVAHHIESLFSRQIEQKQLGLIFVGNETLTIVEALPRSTDSIHFQDVEAAKNYFERVRTGFDLIYLKGSKSTHLDVLLK